MVLLFSIVNWFTGSDNITVYTLIISYIFQILQQVKVLITELCSITNVDTPDEMLDLDQKLDERVRFVFMYQNYAMYKA